jgi:hypothetical protein
MSHVDMSSRKKGEFIRRTIIFEGAFRAWSHLGGLEPEEIESRSAADLNPLDYPLVEDSRVSDKGKDGSAQGVYPCEPLPTSGLSHPYVQAILSPWLGPDADKEIKLQGLVSLRTWWQHRRYGPSRTACKIAMGTEPLQRRADRYTWLFFAFGHCIVVHDKVQAPRSLQTKIRERERQSHTTRSQELQEYSLDAVHADLANPNLTPLEKLHIVQRRIQESSGNMAGASPIIDLKGKCVPGTIDLPMVLDAVECHAAQSMHSSATGAAPDEATSGSKIVPDYGDPDTTPVVFTTRNGDVHIAMTVDGIICAHCVKIVETVLLGQTIDGKHRSPIDGLLDAAADRDIISSVLIKIDQASNAKRIAFEAARNLSLVGYRAEAKTMSVGRADLDTLSAAFAAAAHNDPQDLFDWTAPCTCPDHGIFRVDCQRHSQMNAVFFDAFDDRAQQVEAYMTGDGDRQSGLGCTSGRSRCRSPMVYTPTAFFPTEVATNAAPCGFGPPRSVPIYRTIDEIVPIETEPETDLSRFLLAPNLEDFDFFDSVDQSVDMPGQHHPRQGDRDGIHDTVSTDGDSAEI